MIIFIDESGSFVRANQLGAWNAIAAYVIPEHIQSATKSKLIALKTRSGVVKETEIKLKDVTEENYFNFLLELGSLDGRLFVAVTDAGLNTIDNIISHRHEQAEKIRKNIPLMIYDSGKQSVARFADDVESLSPQLYVQLQCQTLLLHDIVKRGLLFFVQRYPKTLRRFKWRIDQKNSPKALFESTFKTFAPMLLQSISLRDPVIFLQEADYSYFRPYEYGPDDVPPHIEAATHRKLEGGVNIGKLLRENLDFPNSKDDLGVQIADLLASGIRRCLRKGFSDNQKAAELLGRLMVENLKSGPPLLLLGFGPSSVPIPGDAAALVLKMKARSRAMLL